MIPPANKIIMETIITNVIHTYFLVNPFMSILTELTPFGMQTRRDLEGE